MALTKLSATTDQTLHNLYDEMAYRNSQKLVEEAFSEPFCMDKIEFKIAKMVIYVLSERRSQSNKLSLEYEKQKEHSVRENARSYRDLKNNLISGGIAITQLFQVATIALPSAGYDAASKILSSIEHAAQTGKGAYDNILQADRIKLQANSDHYNMRCNQAIQECQSLSQEEIAALNALREALRQKNETLSRIAQ